MAFVLDGSVAVAWLLPDEMRAELDALQDSLVDAAAIVPSLWPIEVGNALLVAARRGRIDPSELEHLVRAIQALHIEIDTATAEFALTRTLELARLHRLTTYDATYLELAIRTGLPLATLDKDLRRACAAEHIPLAGA